MPVTPQRECDLIMKGGTTSGTVYPHAIRRLMERYRLVNVGGTSAGAIAAAAAAAAEVGRESGGLEKLDAIAEELPAKLRSFFQPRVEARTVFQCALQFVTKKRKWLAILSCIPILARHYYLSMLVWMACFAICLFVITVGGEQGRYSVSAQILLSSVSFALCFLGWFVLSVIRLCYLGAKQISSENGFGLCPGTKQSGEEDAFSDWMARRLLDLAGFDKGRKKPLTFGDLTADSKRRINLVMLTTSVTDESPMTVPFTPDEQYYFYRDAEGKTDLDDLIPPDIIDWIVEQSGQIDSGFVPLPQKEDFPVILAVRLSLSFPILFTTVTLHRKNRMTGRFEPVVFSDGGATSNFPIHFFDAVWPSRPTFGITLDRTSKPKTEEITPEFGSEIVKKVVEPRVMSSGIDFLTALLSTAQNWQDNQLSNMPSARQRIMHIPLRQQEGGLNIQMSEDLIRELISRGEAAGKRFEEFDWDEHLWTRYVNSIDAFSRVARQIRNRWGDHPQDSNLQCALNEMKCFVEAYYQRNPEVPQSSGWGATAIEFASDLAELGSDKNEVLLSDKSSIEARLVPAVKDNG